MAEMRGELLAKDHCAAHPRLRRSRRPDVGRGIAAALAWSMRTGGRIVHARGYVSALIALALRASRGTRLLFDMRGFWGDEKVDAGHWARDSRLYRTTKNFERRFFESADAIVSLTHAGVREFPGLGYRIRAGIPIEVIPTCTDVDRFAPGPMDPALVARRSDGHLVLGCRDDEQRYLRTDVTPGVSASTDRSAEDPGRHGRGPRGAESARGERV